MGGFSSETFHETHASRYELKLDVIGRDSLQHLVEGLLDMVPRHWKMLDASALVVQPLELVQEDVAWPAALALPVFVVAFALLVAALVVAASVAETVVEPEAVVVAVAVSEVV